MKRFLLIFLFFLYGISVQSILFAQQDTLQFICSFSSNDSSYTDGPGVTPLVDTTEMAIILCAEKDQPKEVSLQFFINNLKENIPDYFDKVTFGNYKVNVSKVLVKSIDSLAGTATLFELPDTVVLFPPIDTSFVVQPWLVRNVLAQADSVYDFNDFDSDGDGIVDFVAFMLIRFRPGWSTGTTGLSINSFYYTEDSTASGIPVKIDGRGYLSYSGDRAIIQRLYNAGSENLISLSAHELGHALFDFPDMDHSGGFTYYHYALGQFDAMSGGGFNGVASLYNPVLRSNKGWASANQITSNQTLTFSDFDLSGSVNYYSLPDYNHSSPPAVQTSSGQKLYLSYYSRPSTIRWQQYWPLPKSLQEDYRGVLIWHARSGGSWFDRNNLPIDIESAHGKWDWVEDRADTISPPNDKRAIRSTTQDPLTGLDSLEVRYSYRWLRYDSTDIHGNPRYTEFGTYPDKRIGSATCFFDPLNPQKMTFYSNPNSNHTVTTGTPDSRSLVSGFRMDSLRLDGSTVKTNIFIGASANTLTENVTLPKGVWRFISSVTIPSGITLTLQPGTVLYFYNGSSLIVDGILTAEGTSSEAIVFNFVDGSATGISVRNGGTANLEYCQVSNANIGITTSHTGTNIITLTVPLKTLHYMQLMRERAMI